MLTEAKLQMCLLKLSGENISDIAKEIGVSRQSIYNWSQEPDCIARMEELTEEIKREGNNKITGRLNIYIQELHTLATTSKDARTRASVTMYLLDRVLGKIKTTTEIVGEEKETVDVDILDQEMDLVEQEELQAKLKLIK